jgi:SAM-dependent methyltransferase
MSAEVLHVLAPDMLELFARKGVQSGTPFPQIGNANGVKVRRIMQLLVDLTARPVGELSVLDLACGDGALADYLPGIRYAGLDASPGMVEVGRRRGRDLILGDLAELLTHPRHGVEKEYFAEVEGKTGQTTPEGPLAKALAALRATMEAREAVRTQLSAVALQVADGERAGRECAACPVCGGVLVEVRGKIVCGRCHQICETCCEGGRA